MKFVDTYRINTWVTMKNIIQHKSKEWAHTLMFSLALLENRLTLNLQNDISILENGNIDFINPSINFSSSQVSPYTIYGGLNNVGNFRMGFARPSTELSNLGYNISVDMGKTLSITPTLDYNYSKHIAF